MKLFQPTDRNIYHRLLTDAEIEELRQSVIDRVTASNEQIAAPRFIRKPAGLTGVIVYCTSALLVTVLLVVVAWMVLRPMGRALGWW